MTWRATAVLLAGAALVVTGPVTTARAEVGGPPGGQVACGRHVTGHVVLTHDLTCTDAPDGLVLVGDVTLDLGGHTLTGPRRLQGEPTRALALDAAGATVEVRNGTVTGWTTGLDLLPVAGVAPPAVLVVSDLDVTGNLATAVRLVADRAEMRRTTVDDASSGTVCETTAGCLVADSRFTRLSQVAAFCTGSCTFLRSTFVGNGLGIAVGSADVTVLDSTLRRHAVAIEGDARARAGALRLERTTFVDNDVAVTLVDRYATLTANVFRRNGTAYTSRDGGQWWHDTSPQSLVGNVVTGNRDGIVSTSTALRLRRNVVTDNTGRGLDAPAATDAGQNVVARNGGG